MRRLAGVKAAGFPGVGDGGQAVIEFALVSVSLLLFLVGALDFGRAVYYYDVLANNARDGARRAIVLADSDWSISGNQPATYTTSVPYLGTNTVVGSAAARSFGMDPSKLVVTIGAPMGTGSGLQLPVTVSTQYVYQPFAGSFLGIGAITVTASSTMRIK